MSVLESKGAGLCSFRRLPEAPLGVEPPNLKVEQGGDGEPGHERGHAAPSSAINLAEGERAERSKWQLHPEIQQSICDLMLAKKDLIEVQAAVDRAEGGGKRWRVAQKGMGNKGWGEGMCLEEKTCGGGGGGEEEEEEEESKCKLVPSSELAYACMCTCFTIQVGEHVFVTHR